jgi:hypothetical protein
MSACRICSRSDRPAIDAQIVSGVAFRALVSQFPGTTLGGLHRHKRHIRDALVNAQERRARESSKRADDNLQLVDRLVEESFIILASTRASGELRNASTAVGNLIRLAELRLRMDGQLSPAQSLHLHAHANAPAEPESLLTNDRELAVFIAQETGFDPRRLEQLRKLLPAKETEPPIA